jgi:ketosteroid isomerase-like protein
MKDGGPICDAFREVEAAEEVLRDAALRGDVTALDAVLAEDFVFINLAGQLLSKADDLALHRTGALQLSHLAFSDFHFRSFAPDLVQSVLRADASGRMGGAPFTASLRFSRIWRRDPDGWRVASAQATPIG